MLSAVLFLFFSFFVVSFLPCAIVTAEWNAHMRLNPCLLVPSVGNICKQYGHFNTLIVFLNCFFKKKNDFEKKHYDKKHAKYSAGKELSTLSLCIKTTPTKRSDVKSLV